MSAPRIILASLPSFCQKLSKWVEIWRSSDKNNFAQFFWETVCVQQAQKISTWSEFAQTPWARCITPMSVTYTHTHTHMHNWA